MQLRIEPLEKSIIKITPSKENNGSLDIDVTCSESFVSKFKECLDRGNKNIIIDMQHISYSDSSGLWAFEECHKRTGNDNGKLVFINVHPDIMRLFETVGFHKRLSIVTSLEEAIATLV